MIDLKLLQSLGSIAARTVEGKYPHLQIRFLALRDGTEIKVAIVGRADQSGQTARILELQPVSEVNPDVVKSVTDNLQRQIETLARGYAIAGH